MLHVEEGRRGDLDEVDVFATGELLKGMRAPEHELGVDGGAIEVGIDLVEVLLAGVKLIGKNAASATTCAEVFWEKDVATDVPRLPHPRSP